MSENKIEYYEEQIKSLKETINKIYEEQIKPLSNIINEFDKCRIKEIIKEKKYITDFSGFEDKEIVSITAINSKGKEVFVPTDDLIFIKNGRLKFSSTDGGIVNWDKEQKAYIHYFHHSKTKLDIIGFIDIKFED